jgi:hypothetical protein
MFDAAPFRCLSINAYIVILVDFVTYGAKSENQSNRNI